MSDRLAAVKAQFDAMIARMKEEFGRQVDLKMEVLMEMWREEKRRVENAKRNMRGRAGKRIRKDKAAEGGHQSDDNEDSVSVKSEIESDECDCSSDEDDYSNFEVKAESSGEEDATAPVASTSRGQKRQAAPVRNIPAKKRRVDTERQESTSGSGIYKMKTIIINCTEDNCQRTFRCAHKMREHLLAFHQVQPFQCRAQGCDQQFDKQGELIYHSASHPRPTTWLCPHCPLKTFTSGSNISHHICYYHQSGQYQCAVGQCHFTGPTRQQVHIHQRSTHTTAQHTSPFEGCSKVFKDKRDLTRHQLTHTSTKPFRCTMANCGYESNRRGSVVTHIRIVHFHLPKSLKEQHHLGIIDHRNPNEYIEVDHEALRTALQH